MKTIALISLIIVAGLLLVPTIQAAPSCCDPRQAQGQAGMFPSAPQAGGAFPVAPKSLYVPPVPQTPRATAPEARYIRASQPSAPYYPVSVVPVQAIFANPPTAPVAVAPGSCGCGALSKAADYPAPSGSCCNGRGLNVPKQAAKPAESAPSCCTGRVKAAAQTLSCCTGRVKSAAPTPNCCTGQVKSLALVPNCCAVGPKTAAQPFTGNTGRISSSYLPLQARPAVIQTGFQSNVDFATRIPAGAASTLRFGNLW